MKIKYLEDTSAYLNDECKQRILFELYSNSLRTIKSVYIFNNFNEYVIQCNSDKNEEKSNVYWNSNYFEKMIDLVKISLAFETFNKAVLLEEGYLIHKLQKNSFNKLLFTVQEKGFPIKTMDFMEVCCSTPVARLVPSCCSQCVPLAARALPRTSPRAEQKGGLASPYERARSGPPRRSERGTKGPGCPGSRRSTCDPPLDGRPPCLQALRLFPGSPSGS